MVRMDFLNLSLMYPLIVTYSCAPPLPFSCMNTRMQKQRRRLLLSEAYSVLSHAEVVSGILSSLIL